MDEGSHKNDAYPSCACRGKPLWKIYALVNKILQPPAPLKTEHMGSLLINEVELTISSNTVIHTQNNVVYSEILITLEP